MSALRQPLAEPVVGFRGVRRSYRSYGVGSTLPLLPRYTSSPRYTSWLRQVRTTGASESGGSEAPEIYNNITVYWPLQRQDHYFHWHIKRTSRSQLTNKLAAKGYMFVARVPTAPDHVLQLVSCPDNVVDMDEVELQDGAQLAVVVDGDFTPIDKMSKSLAQVQEQAKEVSGWQRGVVAGQESEGAEWAVKRLEGDPDVQRFYFKNISTKSTSLTVNIEVDGMAVSALRVVLVERKPRITMEYVLQLVDKVSALKLLVAIKAPNTQILLDQATGQLKPLEAVLMADGWVDDPTEQAACMVCMHEARITPVLPRASSHDVGDSCHPWPPTEAVRALARTYRPKAAQQGSGESPAAAGAGEADNN